MTLVLDHVTKKYGKNTAVDDLSLEIPARTMYGFLGGNGAGKTTTFRMILDLIDNTSGHIYWNGEQIDYKKSDMIGYLPEERGLYPKLKVKEQLVYLGKLRGMSGADATEEVRKWLERFNVSGYLDKRVEELSKGNQQKIQFISAVLHQPELLILDEPFSGLDPVNVEVVKKAVVELKEAGTSIVFSSHQMDHVEELCESLCILHEGKTVAEGGLREVKAAYGKKNLRIHADFDLSFLEDVKGVVSFKGIMEGCQLQIADESVSQDIFEALQGKGFIRKFELEEPSLNDIFIEKVGASFE